MKTNRKTINILLRIFVLIGVLIPTGNSLLTDSQEIPTEVIDDSSRDHEGDTFSIVAYDKTTGQVGGAGCSCVSISGGIDFLSDLITDGTTNQDNIVGAIHSQASYQSQNQANARARMLAGDSPQQIINWLENNDCCGGPGSRQYGVVGVDNPGAAGYTGASNGNYANDLQIDNAFYTVSIQGNILDTSNGQDLLDDMRDSFNNSTGTLADKLMSAMQAAKRVGGDNRCASRGNSGRTAFVQVLSPGETSPSLFFTTGNAVADGVEPIDELQCLYDSSITPPTCRETVTSFPYVMDFEDTVWVKDENNCTGNDKSWIRTRFATPSSNTGPSSATQGQLYMFVEASSFFNGRAIMTSPCLVLPSNESVSLSYNYHMFGADMGTLSVTINNGSGWTTLWSLSGDQGNSWQSQEIDLSAYQGQTVRLRFDGVTGANFASDMAVDNVRVGAPAPVNCGAVVDSFPYAESFESNFGVWNQSSNDDINWSRRSGGTPSNNTGPSSAFDGSTYIYVEASGNGTGYPNKRAIIESACFDLSSATSANFSFNYHQFGAADMGTIDLEVSTNGGNSWSSIWNSSGNLGNQWLSQNIDLAAYLGEAAVSLRFNRVTGGTWQADIALDNFVLDAVTGPDIEPPTAPTNLTASNTTETTTDLDWDASTDNVGVTGYDVYEGATVIGTTAGTSFNVTGLSPSTSYSFTVVAKDAEGNESAASNAANVTTLDPPDTEAPTSPTNLSASNITMFTLDLSWDASTDNVGVTGYDVFEGATLLGSTATTTFNVTGLSPATLYTFTVVAKDDAGNESAPSAPLDVTTMADTIAPSAPTNLVASNTTQTTTDLTWDAATDNIGVTGYDVLEGATVIGSTAGTSFNVTGLTAATSYSFTVVAKDAAGNVSAPSNAANVTTLDPPDTEAPTSPTNLSASNITMFTLDLSWDASTDNVGVTGYDVFEGVSLIGSTANTTFNVTGLSPATLYTFTVVAKDEAGNQSAPSAPLDVTTMADTIPPSAPTNLTASNTTDTTTDLSWSAATDNIGVTGYDVLEGATVIGSTAGTSFNVTGLSPSTSYSFTVVARDAAGNTSAPSNAANVTTLDPPDTEAPTSPTNLSASNVTMFTLDLSWSASTDNVGVVGYDVFEGASLLGSTAGTFFNVTGLSPATLYTFTVVAKDAAGNQSAPSAPLDVTTMADTIAPSAPSNLTASNTTQTTTDLSWNASTDNIGVVGYDVFEGASFIGSTGGTNFNVTGLIADTSYSFTVRARDAAGNQSSPSNTANITTLPAATGCAGGTSNYPYVESFEANFGGWVQSAADDLDWTRRSGGTPSNNTGPASATDGSVYIYVEASGNGTGYPNKQAIITSPCFDLSNESVAFFNFNYHQFGSNDMGSIALEISDDDGVSWAQIWSQTGNQGNSWLGTSIDLSAYIGSGVQLRFNRITGGTWQADIAIDNINLVNTVSSGCSGGLSLPYSESFESSIGAWSQSNQDDINWTRDANGTPSQNTGPSNASDGSFYMYVEASGNGTGYPNKRAIFNSPCFDLSGLTSANFAFDYHQFGSNDMGSIVLEVSTDDGGFWTPIWSRTGNQGNQWNSVSLDISAYVGGGALFRFNRVTGGTWQADIAIDNVSVTGSGGLSPITPPEGSDDVEINDPIVAFTLYPNPVKSGVLNVSHTGVIESYVIYNMYGQVVMSGKFNEYIDVSRLSSASYMIELNTGSEKLVGQFIVE